MLWSCIREFSNEPDDILRTVQAEEVSPILDHLQLGTGNSLQGGAPLRFP